MRLWRILVVATAVELSLVAAAAALAGLAGAWSEWLDLANVPAPFWIPAGALGAALGAWLVPPGRTRTGVVVLGLVAVVAAGLRVAPELARTVWPSPPVAVGRPLTLLTLNTWIDNGDPAATAAVIRRSGADVVLLQEASGIASERRGLRDAYPNRSRCRGRASGLLIMTRLPVLDEGCLTGSWPRRSPEDIEAAWMRLAAPDGRPVTVVTTHIGWPIPAGVQPRQSAALARFLEGFEPGSVIVTGDFNTVPWTWAMGRQDARFAPLTRRTRALPSWPARAPRLGKPWSLPFLPIDHVYATPDWRSLEVRRAPSGGSDHFGVRVRLNRLDPAGAAGADPAL